jgi:nucleotide-binding universal stress UspA family protein
MINVKKILWPTDFSDNSKTSQMYAHELAVQFSAELHIIHVIVDPAYVVSPMGVGYIPDSYQADVRERSDKELAEQLADAVDLTIVRETIDGAAAESITQYAQDNDINMIVMGTHGYSGLSRLLLGSVAEKVVRSAPCPVLTVHSEDQQLIDAK